MATSDILFIQTNEKHTRTEMGFISVGSFPCKEENAMKRQEDEGDDLPDFSYGSLFVSFALGLCWTRGTEGNVCGEEESAKIVLDSNTRFDDVSFLKRFESIVQNVPFGLHIGESEREWRSMSRERTDLHRS